MYLNPYCFSFFVIKFFADNIDIASARLFFYPCLAYYLAYAYEAELKEMEGHVSLYFLGIKNGLVTIPLNSSLFFTLRSFAKKNGGLEEASELENLIFLQFVVISIIVDISFVCLYVLNFFISKTEDKLKRKMTRLHPKAYYNISSSPERLIFFRPRSQTHSTV
ncbi:hypothetical protein ACJX0J_031112, partial [Zea mays]